MDPRVFFTLGFFTKVKNTPGPPRRRGRRRRLLRRSRVPWLESWCVRKPAARPTRSCATRWGERVINAASPNKLRFTTAARTKISEIGRPIPNWSGILPADQSPLRSPSVEKIALWSHPPKDLEVHSGPPATLYPCGLPGQHQRKVKNTQIYEFYHFPKNSRMQCGL